MHKPNNPPEYSQELMEEVKGIVNQRIVHYGNLSTFKTSMRYTRGQKTKREYKTILRALEAAEGRIKELEEQLAACKRANSALIISYGEPNDK